MSRLAAQIEATEAGALPDGEHVTQLVEVTVKPRKKGGWWLVVISQHSNGRYAREMKQLGNDEDDWMVLSAAQRVSLGKFAERFGIRESDAKAVVDELTARIGADCQVTIAKTAHGTTVRHSAPRGIMLSTQAGALTVQGEVLNPNSAHSSHEKLLQGLQGARLALSLVAEACFEISRDLAYKSLGYDHLAQYLASPEISMSRTEFFRYASIHERYVIDGGADPARLSVAGPSKLEIPLKALAAGEVSIEEALGDVESLGRKDLRDKYRDEAEEESRQRDCPRCAGIPDEVLDEMRARYAA